MTRHALKTWPMYFDHSWNGKKCFEVRVNDRDFMIGDEVVLREYTPHTDTYSGREIHGEIVYVTAHLQRLGVVIFQYKEIRRGILE